MLVSVIVITYNSSPYVLETLESAYRQTYPDLELIVSDDCSSDNTFALCQEWVSAHASRFRRALCTQTPRNLGICGNNNHALTHATGEWVKYIAGDDFLRHNCIERMVANLKEGTALYFCNSDSYDNSTHKVIYHLRFILPDGSARRQMRMMLKTEYDLGGPSLFVRRQALLEVGGFDTRFPMMEDFPIAMRFLAHGKNIHVVPESLVVWRMHGDNVSFTGRCSDSRNEAKWHYAKTYCLRHGLPLHLYSYWVSHWVLHHHRNGLHKALGYLLRCFDIVHIKRRFFPVVTQQYERA